MISVSVIRVSVDRLCTILSHGFLKETTRRHLGSTDDDDDDGWLEFGCLRIGLLHSTSLGIRGERLWLSIPLFSLPEAVRTKNRVSYCGHRMQSMLLILYWQLTGSI